MITRKIFASGSSDSWFKGNISTLLILVIAGTTFISPANRQNHVAERAQTTCQMSVQSPQTPSKPFTGPIFVTPGQYNSALTEQFLELGPLNVRVIAAGPNIRNYDEQVQILAEINGEGITKSIGFSSYRDLEEKLAQPGPEGFPTHADFLHSIGVVGFTYSTETSSGLIPWTPDDEMDNLFSTDPDTNSVVQFVNIAKNYGFDFVLWVPTRDTVDGLDPTGQKIPDAEQAIALMYQAGLSGVGLQEQFLIDRQCVPERVAAFNETLQIQTESAGETKPYILINGLMESCTTGDEFAEESCGLPPDHYPWQHCDQFVDQVADQLDALSFLDQPSQKLIDFIKTLRSESVPPFLFYLPLAMRE